METKTFDLGDSVVSVNFGRGRSRNDETLLDRLKAAKTEIITTFSGHWCDMFLNEDRVEKDFSAFDLTTMGSAGNKKDEFLTRVRSLGDRFGTERDITLKDADGQNQEVHILPSLLSAGQDLQKLMDEASRSYPILLELSKSMEKDDTNADMYEVFLRQHIGELPAFSELIQLGLVYASNSSMVERRFSTTNNNLTKLRNRLDTRTLELLVLLHKGAPSLKEFDFGKFVTWLCSD
eukprot:969369_1